jgi:hypothetical protein
MQVWTGSTEDVYSANEKLLYRRVGKQSLQRRDKDRTALGKRTKRYLICLLRSPRYLSG